jgi:hypothetical protein
MSKQIPELDIIATPTAGQESLIETVVARHDTYATSRMTLAQIFTLGSISGSIKVALDALTTAYEEIQPLSLLSSILLAELVQG